MHDRDGGDSFGQIQRMKTELAATLYFPFVLEIEFESVFYR